MRHFPPSSPYAVNWQNPVNLRASLNAGLRLWYLVAPPFAGYGTTAGVLNNLLRSYQATVEANCVLTANGGAGASFKPRPGGWGCAVMAAAADQQITIPGNLFSSLAEGTIAFWVMWDSATQDQYSGTRYGVCFGRTNSGSSFNNLMIELDTSDADTAKITYNPYTGTAAATCTSTTTPGRWVWNHVCVTTKTGAHALYVNGVQESTGATAGSFNSATDAARWGGYKHSSAPSYMSGAVDDFRFYDRVLSDTEVCELYHESRNFYPTLLQRWTDSTRLPKSSTFQAAWAARCNKYMTAGSL